MKTQMYFILKQVPGKQTCNNTASKKATITHANNLLLVSIAKSEKITYLDE